MENYQEEIWKDVVGYEGLYKVSNLGRVKALERKIIKQDGTIRDIRKEIILKIHISDYGYCRVMLSKNGVQNNYRVHRLVAIAFIENPKNKPQVNHIDHDKTNNKVENLEWVSNLENCCHARKRIKSTSSYMGVHFNKRKKKWRAEIRYNNKSITIGYYKTEEEAYQARKNFEVEKGIDNKYA